MRPTVAFLIACCIGLSANCRARSDDTPTAQFLADAWIAYKAAYIDPEGYVLDRTRNDGEVTSEGQAYALMRAAWMDDRETFQRVFEWTERTLARPDGLYSWRWSPREGGKVLDANTATDGDQDIAFALIVAAQRFAAPEYRHRAQRLLRAIKDQTAVTVNNGWFPSAGNWAVPERIVNLSYFAPYAYPYFDRVDPESGWTGVIDQGYALLQQATSGGRLPPDFMTVDHAGRMGSLPAASTLSRTFSFDAIRILWRVEFDCRLHQRPVACATLGGVPAIADVMSRDGRLFTDYEVDRTARTDQHSLTFEACVLPALARSAPAYADQWRQEHLGLPALRAVVARADRYYDLNWIWFGLALTEGWLVERTPPLALQSGAPVTVTLARRHPPGTWAVGVAPR